MVRLVASDLADDESAQALAAAGGFTVADFRAHFARVR
jgi:hypothetical protein